MLTSEDPVLILVDLQVKLSRVMHEREALIQNAVKLVQGAKLFRLPIIASEQNPAGLGPTIPELAELLEDTPVISKMSFSCCGEPAFMEELEKQGREIVLVAGIESHVCVYQTVIDLLDLGYEVEVIADAVSSRTPENRAIGWERCTAYGASLTSVETLLFELLGTAKSGKFKDISKIVK
jgi:nicotinamidase-related amidase